MAELIEKIDNILREQALPATRKLQTVLSSAWFSLCDKAEETIREASMSPRSIARLEDAADRAEHHMYSTVPTAPGDETVAKVRRRLSGNPDVFDAVDLLSLSIYLSAISLLLL